MDDVTEVPYTPCGVGIRPPTNDCSPDWPLPRLDDQVWGFVKTKPRPFMPHGNTPLTWWRSSPPRSFRDQERSIVDTTLRQIAVVNCGNELAVALRGDAAAAIAVALSLMPIVRITLHTDIAATALLRCALSSNASAALVLAQLIGLSGVHLPQAVKLATSWLEYGAKHSTDPQKFREGANIVLAALLEG